MGRKVVFSFSHAPLLPSSFPRSRTVPWDTRRRKFVRNATREGEKPSPRTPSCSMKPSSSAAHGNNSRPPPPLFHARSLRRERRLFVMRRPWPIPDQGKCKRERECLESRGGSSTPSPQVGASGEVSERALSLAQLDPPRRGCSRL